MRVGIVHVPYLHRGGEDIHVEVLARAYRELGHRVEFFPWDRKPAIPSLKESARTLLPGRFVPHLNHFNDKFKPDIFHVHHVYPTLGPRFLRWLAESMVPAVMTVHNHRFFCTNGLALRNGHICKDCFGSKVLWRPLVHNCNGDYKKSAYYAAAITEARIQKLHEKAFRRFIAPSPYIASELMRYGIDRKQVTFLMNPAITVSGLETSVGAIKYDVLFAGRLSPEKGISVFLDAARRLPDKKFVVVGDGPERWRVETAKQTMANLEFRGQLPHAEVQQVIRESQIAALPSICNEILPTTVLEAFFWGKRCVVPELPSTNWLARPPFAGIPSRPGDGWDLARAIAETLAMPPVSSDQLMELRERLSFARFCEELRGLIESLH